MLNNLRLLVLGGAACIAGVALAATPVAAVPAAPVDGPMLKLSDTLTRIEAETLVLKAREKQLGVQAAIVARQQEIATRTTDIARSNNAPVQGRPTLVGIEGVGRVLFATLEMDNGMLVDVQQGDRLPNGMRVLAISTRSVTVNAGGRRLQLTQSRRAPGSGAFNAAFPPAGVLLPPLPPAAPGVALGRSAEK
jgi:type IV pilus biogenesis protein PilP